jgi:predicted nucleic acid-binding protein
MKVLVDTSVWSLALRRSSTAVLNAEQQNTVVQLSDLIRDGRAVMIGAIRQELLSGLRTVAGFDTLKLSLAAFEDLPLVREDYEKAAEVFNTCRSHGVQGSNTDFLICAASINHGLPIFSVDKDFLNIEKHLLLLRHV